MEDIWLATAHLLPSRSELRSISNNSYASPSLIYDTTSQRNRQPCYLKWGYNWEVHKLYFSFYTKTATMHVYMCSTLIVSFPFNPYIHHNFFLFLKKINSSFILFSTLLPPTTMKMAATCFRKNRKIWKNFPPGDASFLKPLSFPKNYHLENSWALFT